MKRCLIIDDSSVIRKVAKRILTSAEMVVVESGNGSQALDMCEAMLPDIIVVDALLPDMTAVDFIRHFKTYHPTAQSQILLCLTEMDLGAIMRARRAGATGHMLKPFNRAQLLERFRQLQTVSPAAAA